MGAETKESIKMKVFPKGQIVIPVSLRKKYQIEIGFIGDTTIFGIAKKLLCILACYVSQISIKNYAHRGHRREVQTRCPESHDFWPLCANFNYLFA